LEEVVIRDMSVHDLNDVHLIESRIDTMPWSVNALKYEIENRDSILKVASLDKKIIGYACIRTLLDVTHVMKIAVLPRHRRKGIGSLLLRGSLNELRTSGSDVSYITLEVRSSNSAAIKLYNKFGFRVTGKRIDYYKNPVEDGIVMQLDMIA
jgi:ribosomal-protein-alanine N-acetyltransferase